MVAPSPLFEQVHPDNSGDAGYCPVPTYTNLRTLVFGTDLSELAGRKADSIDRVWGIVMETGFPEAAVTLLALADGTVSVYLSSGGGLTGLGDYEQIHNASQRLIGLAAEFTLKCAPVSEFPLPDKGCTRIYLLTYTGALGIEASEPDLLTHPELAPLFDRGHELMVMIRTFGEQLAAERGDLPASAVTVH